MPFAGGAAPTNSYATSIHVLVSACVKLARATAVPPGRRVFRGLGGMVLGPEWFRGDARGVRSGVELGFLSTTLDQHVALEYSGVHRGTGAAPAPGARAPARPPPIRARARAPPTRPPRASQPPSRALAQRGAQTHTHPAGLA